MTQDLATYIRSAIILITYPLILIFLALIGSAGCAVDDPPIVTVDAATCVDVTTCIARDQRVEECKHLCSLPELRCGDASGSACFDECAQLTSGTAYCPFGGQ